MTRSWRTGTDRPNPQDVSRAAQYLRMSTEHQKYSTENQAAAIAKYAERRDLTVTRTYQDDGKSGLQLKGRPALRQLIADAQNKVCDFSHILVYDVSRWGRFQDVDESAYYEFICKEAGLTIHYCAEQFENDGSLIATLIKSLKRAMAAEYSRELSVKVFAGQSRLVLCGYRVGAAAGVGLRRLLVDQDGNPKFILQGGERKSIFTDRIKLVQGPQDEVAFVRRIYELFVIKKKTEQAIAKLLDQEGAAYSFGRHWTDVNVHYLLTNEKYIGNNVFNRRSQKLHQRRVNNPPEMWVRADGCFEAVIETKQFEEARRIIKARKETRGDEYLLDRLRRILAAEGRLSMALIDSDTLGPTTQTYRRRFGSLPRAYALIGYECKDPRLSRYSKKHLLDCLRTLLAEEGNLSKELIDADRHCPHTRTYCRHFGGLRRVYEIIGYKPEKSRTVRGKRGRFVVKPPSSASKLMARRTAVTREWRARKRAKQNIARLSPYPE